MNEKDLVIYLRHADLNAHMGFGGDWKTVYAEAADHIEAQNKLIRDLSDCLEDMTKHYVEVRNDLYGFEATEEIEVIVAGKLIALSKSNPNTPERNDE